MLITALLLALQLGFPLASTGHPPLFSPGERLHYRGYVLGYFPVGDVWFGVNKATYKGREAYRFDARALGHYVIYTLDIRLRSIVDASNLRSRVFRRREVGTEKRDYKIVFDRDEMKATHYRKRGKFSTVEEMDAAPWEKRAVFPISPEVNDILYTLYFARDIGDKVGTKRYYWFVETTSIWKTLVTISGEEKINLGRAGTFDTLKVMIEPDYSRQPEKGARFSGLFGVMGSLEVWVDKKTRIPLIVRGQVPFAYILRPTISVILQDYTLP
ncbi:MAG: DUF3108 domain-containing protein [Candidatus Aureabacteria bacterium]|nr:DUF3108 domain-containing protein [Candidatus Auribacterota bacterium]